MGLLLIFTGHVAKGATYSPLKMNRTGSSKGRGTVKYVVKFHKKLLKQKSSLKVRQEMANKQTRWPQMWMATHWL